MGSGKDPPSTGTCLVWSTITMNCFADGRHDLFFQERTATTLDEIEVGIDLIGSVDRDVDLPSIFGVERVECRTLWQALAVSCDVGTPRSLMPARTLSPSAISMCFAVDPVPRPTIIPSRTNSTAFSAAALLKLSRSWRHDEEAKRKGRRDGRGAE